MTRYFMPLIIFLIVTSLRCTSTTSSGSHSNNPPDIPYNPSPANGATNVSVTPTLSWTVTDPDDDVLSHGVFVSTTSNFATFVYDVGLTSPSDYFTSPLNYSTTYYWIVYAEDGEDTTWSPTWSFTTLANATNLTFDYPSSLANYDVSTHILSGTIYVTNSGASAINTSLNYYLSTNNIISTTDILLLTGSTFSVPAGGSSGRSFNIDLDLASVSSGTYWFGAIVDPSNLVAESNENDNTIIRTASFTFPKALPGSNPMKKGVNGEIDGLIVRRESDKSNLQSQDNKLE